MRETILIRAPSHLGDLVMAEPVLRAFDADARFAVRLLGPRRFLAWLAPQLGRCELVGLERGQPERLEHYRGVARALFLNGSMRSPLLACLAGVPERHGLASRARRLLLTHAHRCESPRPFGDVCVELATRMGIRVAQREPRIGLSGRGREAARARLHSLGVDAPFVLVLAGGRPGSAKSLEPALAALALGAEPRALLLVSAPGEEANSQAIRALLPRAALALDVGLEELAALSALSEVVLSADGGARHVARAAGARLVTLFGPTDPRHTSAGARLGAELVGRVDCGPCHRERCPLEGAARHACWRALDPARVAGALRAPLD